MNFNTVLDSAVEQIPQAGAENTAISFDGRHRLTYAELLHKSLGYARALRELGLGKGDRLGLLLYNDTEYVPLLFAASRLGVIAVRLNFRLASAELRFILADAGCKALLVHSSLLDRIEPVRSQTGVSTFVVVPDDDREPPGWARPFAELQGSPPLDDAPALGAEDPMSLLYTSGTTGLPKGALWTQGNTVGTATMQALKWSFTHRTVGLVPGPLYHAGGFEAVVAPVLLAHGTAVCLPSGNFSVAHLLDVIEAEQVTDCLLFSFMLGDLLRLDDLESRLPLSLTHIIVGGDTLMPWAVRAARRRIPHVRLTQVYGLTEGGAIATTLDDEDFETHPKSIGRPLPLAQAKVVTGDGAAAGVGEVGEILVRNPGVCGSYWQRPDATRETFADGWCRTGDLGFVDKDGFLTLAGRAKDMIRSGGENVYPAEVEKVLTAHPAVHDAAVIAVPDPKYDEVGCAVLVPAPGAGPDPAALRAYCREHLAGYKVPRHFVFRDELPRNASGKILKYRLRDAYRSLGGIQAESEAGTV